MLNKIKKFFTHPDIMGWACSTLFMICYIPQITKTLQIKEVRDVSLGMWTIQLLAYTFGGCYAIYLKRWPLIYGYWGGWLVTAFFLILYWMYS